MKVQGSSPLRAFMTPPYKGASAVAVATEHSFPQVLKKKGQERLSHPHQCIQGLPQALPFCPLVQERTHILKRAVRFLVAVGDLFLFYFT